MWATAAAPDEMGTQEAVSLDKATLKGDFWEQHTAPFLE